MEAVHKTFPKRAAKYNTVEPAGLPDTPADVVTPQRHVRIAALVRDPMFRWIQALLLIPPILFTLPNGPGLVSITVFGNAIQVFVVPAMIIGLIWMTNNKQWMLKGWANKWWENLILLVIGGIGFWAAWGIAKNLPSQIGGLF